MRRSIRRPRLLFIDLALIATATICALLLRNNLDLSTAQFLAFLPYFALTLLLATAVLLASGLHQSIWRFSVMADYLRVLASVALIIVGAVALGFLVNRLDGVARTLPVIQGLLMAFLLVGARAAMRLRYTSRRRPPPQSLTTASKTHETILVVGVNTVADLFLRSVAEFAPNRMKVAGILAQYPRHNGRRFQQHRILGMPEEIDDILRTLDVHGMTVNRIVVTTAFGSLSPAAQHALLKVEKTSDIRLDLFAERIGFAEPADKPAASLPAWEPHDETGPSDFGSGFAIEELKDTARSGYWRSKRIFDVAAAVLCLVLLMPLIVLVALLVALDVGLPTVFWQQRPGVGGVPFKLYKFRTMRTAHDLHGVRIPDEQRLSAIGRFLRRTRLDELPQLYNILTGEMSFVGPRPLLAIDQASEVAARLLAPPGLTGWAQVMGGRTVSASDKAALDIWYLRHASLWLDITILARTIPMMVFGERTHEEVLQQARADLLHAKRGGGRTGNPAIAA